jgi:hypothetical protein
MESATSKANKWAGKLDDSFEVRRLPAAGKRVGLTPIFFLVAKGMAHADREHGGQRRRSLRCRPSLRSGSDALAHRPTKHGR